MARCCIPVFHLFLIDWCNLSKVCQETLSENLIPGLRRKVLLKRWNSPQLSDTWLTLKSRSFWKVGKYDFYDWCNYLKMWQGDFLFKENPLWIILWILTPLFLLINIEFLYMGLLKVWEGEGYIWQEFLKIPMKVCVIFMMKMITLL